MEKNTLTVRAERKNPVGEGTEMVAAEHPRGIFSRQLILDDALEPDNVRANYNVGVLTLRIPVTEEAKPRRIAIEIKRDQQQIGA